MFWNLYIKYRQLWRPSRWIRSWMPYYPEVIGAEFVWEPEKSSLFLQDTLEINLKDRLKILVGKRVVIGSVLINPTAADLRKIHND